MKDLSLIERLKLKLNRLLKGSPSGGLIELTLTQKVELWSYMRRKGNLADSRLVTFFIPVDLLAADGPIIEAIGVPGHVMKALTEVEYIFTRWHEDKLNAFYQKVIALWDRDELTVGAIKMMLHPEGLYDPALHQETQEDEDDPEGLPEGVEEVYLDLEDEA